MITLDHHPAVQRILDEWKKSLTSAHGPPAMKCTEEDLRQLIKHLEDSLENMAGRLDALHQISLRELARLNIRWIKQRMAQMRLGRTR